MINKNTSEYLVKAYFANIYYKELTDKAALGDLTIISRNCIGGQMYKIYGYKYLSPTVNLFFTPNDFMLFCKNLRSYVDGELTEDEQAQAEYPVGILTPVERNLPSIKIMFRHYKNFETAKAAWLRRIKRINYDNILVVNGIMNPYDELLLENDLKVNPNLINDLNSLGYRQLSFVYKPFGLKNEIRFTEIN